MLITRRSTLASNWTYESESKFPKRFFLLQTNCFIVLQTNFSCAWLATCQSSCIIYLSVGKRRKLCLIVSNELICHNYTHDMTEAVHNASHVCTIQWSLNTLDEASELTICDLFIKGTECEFAVCFRCGTSSRFVQRPRFSQPGCKNRRPELMLTSDMASA